MLIQKSKGSRAFEEQKAKNIVVEYRFFPTVDKGIKFRQIFKRIFPGELI